MTGQDARFAVRTIATLSTVGGLIAVSAGIRNSESSFATRDVAFLIPLGSYFVLVSVGTFFRYRVAALLLTVPPAIAGVYVCAQLLFRGPIVAALMDVLFTIPILCGPAFIVYLSWKYLR